MSPLEIDKRENGRYYTTGNPFVLKPFADWAKLVDLKSKAVLEPFAGANNIIRALQAVGYGKKFSSFDIEPSDSCVIKKDTLKDFPKNFDVCITNPPWLARNSAKRRGLAFPETSHDDLYKHALDACLANCPFVGALIPATFLQSRIFLDRLDSVIFLHDKGMFSDTENPVCLALFKEKSEKVSIFLDENFVGTLNDLQRHLPRAANGSESITFNDPNGELGFIAFDNTREPSIRFCHGKEISGHEIGNSSRMITRISGNFGNIAKTIDVLNNQIARFRNLTNDVFLTPFKGLRKDGRYRRRMDYGLARSFISTYVKQGT